MAQAHRLMTRILQLEPGRIVVAEVPMVDDVNGLVEELAKFGIAAKIFDVPTVIDTRAVRERTGLSQSKFALNYALDEDTIKNWEQGRTSPDHATRAYLSLIAADPEAVQGLLAKAIWQPKEQGLPAR